MLTSSVIFLTLDFYYACWILQLKHKFPSYISEHISKSFYGFSEQMTSNLRANLRKLPNVKRRGGETSKA
jgi:hypothetical protein